MARPVPFSLPQEIVDAARKQRESSAMSTITSDIDSTLSQGFAGLQGIAKQAAQPLEHFAQSVASGGISVPTLEDLTPDWVKAEQRRASEAVSTITTGTLGVQVPSMDDLTPAGMRRPASAVTGATSVTPAGTTLTGPPASSAGAQAPGASTSPQAPAPLPARLDTSSRDANLQQWAPALRAVEQRTGLRADALAAIIQAENGGGQSPLSAVDNNYFSISHVGRPKQAGPGTGGRFARYATPQDSLDDFVDLVSTSPRYADAWANRGDPARFFQGLVNGGYIVPEPGFPVETWMRNLDTGRQHFNQLAPAPSPTQATAQQRTASGERTAAGGGLDVAGITKAYEGQPYVFGGAGGRSDMRPGVATDCSGFVSAVWKNQYGLDLPAHTDGAYNALKQQGAPEIAAAEAQPGDVVFYMGAGTGGAITHHMGISAGGGKVLDMSVSGGDGVKLRDIGHGGRFVVIRDPRVNQQPTRTAAPPPPIVPTGVAERTGGVKLPQGQVNALSQRPVPTEAESPPPVPFAPPERDDWRQSQPGISVPALAQLHPNVSTAFMQANGREPTPDEVAELAALGYGVG